MGLRSFINDSIAVHIGIFLGRVLPRKTGLRLADKIGAWIAKHPNYTFVKAVKANQEVVSNGSLSQMQLDQRTRQVFQSTVRSLFDYFYFVKRPNELFKIISLSPNAELAIQRVKDQQSTLLLSPHMSNFDLMGHSLVLMGLKVQVLSAPSPNEAYKAQNKLRQQTGAIITPMSLSAFRSAKARLKEGGCVVTGIDRPLPENSKEKYQPKFFEHEANLPVFYVRLAKDTDAVIFVMSCVSRPDATYYFECSEPIHITPQSDLDLETIENAEKVLSVTARFIKQAPNQWAMFYPVWPNINIKNTLTGEED